MRLKLSTEGRRAVVVDMLPSTSILDLKAAAASSLALTGVLSMTSGYPPVAVTAADTASLSEAGIRNGDAITFGVATVTPTDHRRVSSDAPPQVPPLDQPHPTNDTAGAWACRRCTLLNDVASAACVTCGTARGMTRVPIPADNSCCYTSVGYIAGGKRRMDGGSAMRALAASHIASHPALYPAAVLGRPVPEYCAFIQRTDTWGGGVELRALSEALAVEIAVADIRTARLSVFGEECGYTSRVYVLYDGIHYDALERRDMLNGPSSTPTVVFPAHDTLSEEQALDGASGW